MAQRKPVKVFRLGSVTGSIFANEVKSDDGPRMLHSVVIQKRYVENNETKYTSSFNLSELPLALRVLQLAQEWVEAQESNVALD